MTRLAGTSQDPWPVVHIMDGFGLAASDVLVLDDQMPGITMAGAAGDDSAAVGWGRNHPDVLERLGDAATVVLPTVGHLRRLLLYG